jgi:hypothetical protein
LQILAQSKSNSLFLLFFLEQKGGGDLVLAGKTERTPAKEIVARQKLLKNVSAKNGGPPKEAKNGKNVERKKTVKMWNVDGGC